MTNLFGEFFGTFVLISFGCAVCAVGLSFGGPAGYAVKPARDLGPRIVHAVLPITGKGSPDWGYAWIPAAGPMIARALAVPISRAIGAL